MAELHFMDLEHVAVPPAAGTWKGAASDDPAVRDADFARDGFLVFRGLIDRHALAELDRELARIVAAREELPHVREGFSVEPRETWPDPDRPVFRKIGGVHDHSPAFRALCRHPLVVGELTRLMAPRIDLHRDVVMMKQAGVGREKPWHQDASYWPYEPRTQISAMTALDRATPANGCLQVLPGSHREDREHHGRELHVTLGDDERARTRFVPLEPGDCLLFHARLLHASAPNRSVHHRRVCIFSYMDRDLRYVGEGDPPVRPRIAG